MIGPTDVFLVSGGARGITAACVVGLAQRFGCGFILLGRTPHAAVPIWAGVSSSPLAEAGPGLRGEMIDDATLKQRIAAAISARGERPLPAAIQREWRAIRASQEIGTTLDAIAAAGGRASYLSADVADETALRVVLAPHRAQITGLIHGAGALADKRIEQKSAADFDAVFGPKIDGLRNLLSCLDRGQLRQIVLFSSAAGFYGNLAQSDYAMANEILNKAAYQLQRELPACRVHALDWGPWDGGMVTPALKAMFAQRGVDVIPLAGGVALLGDLLAAERPPVQLVVGSPMLAAPAPLDGPPRRARIWRSLSLAANPFLADHMIGEHAVLPATAAAAWLVEAAAQQFPGYRLRRCDGFQVLKGIIFDQQLATRYQLDLSETARQEPEGLLRLDALVSSSTANGRPRYHYRATIELARTLAEPPILANLDLRPQGASDGALLYTDGTLFHGPSLRGVVQLLNFSPERLTVRSALPKLAAAAQGQFAAGQLNPFVADSLCQAGLIWVRRMFGAASLPLGWAAAEHYRALAFDTPFYITLSVCEASEQRLVADIAAHNEVGQVALQLRGVEIAVSRQLDRLFVHAEG